MIEFVVLIFTAILIWIYSVNRRPPGFPPVPGISLPIIGHLVYLAQYKKRGLHILFLKWIKDLNSKTFGVDFGRFRCIVISDQKLLKEVFSHQSMSGRPQIPIIRVRGMEDGLQRGILVSEGLRWNEQRRFALMHLKEFGFGKSSMEVTIQAQAKTIVDLFQKDSGTPVSTEHRFNAASVNTIWEMCTGERLNHDDPKLKELIESVEQATRDPDTYGKLFFFPWLIKIAPKLSGWEHYCANVLVLFKNMENLVAERFKKFRPAEGTRNDFIDVYFHEMEKCEDKTKGFYGDDGRRTLSVTLADLFLAGSDTTSTSMQWLCLYLALHPNIQHKVHEEIDREIGQDRLPCIADRKIMLYTEACILELLRKSSIVHLGVFHRAFEDVGLSGIFIPKNTIVFPNIYGIHHDKDIWGDDVDSFRPERFLTLDQLQIINSDALVAFSTGRRVCIGESMARNELFLFTTYLLQKFEIKLNPNAPVPPAEPNHNSGLHIPQTHKLIFVERNGERVN